jgi:hypothetical protein
MAADATSNSRSVKPVSQLATASDLSRKLESLRSKRQNAEIEWKLNVRFYRGDQYTYFNPGTKRIESVPTQDGEIPRYRVRITSNQIMTGVQSLMSKLVKSKPIWGATPNEPGDKAVKAAQFAADLLEAKWRDLHTESKYKDAMLWSLLASNGYLLADWDQYANDAYTFLMDPQGQPIVDDALEKEFRAQLEKQGIDPKQFEKVVYMGDVCIESVSPFDVYIDDVAKDASEAKWCFIRRYMTPDDIKVRWKKDVKADSIPTGVGDTLGLGASAGDPTVKAVWCFWAVPQPSMPKGRQVVFIEDEDEILEDTPWRYPKMTRLPLVQIKGIRVPGQNTDDALVTQARPLQKQVNRMLSQITEYFNLTVKPRIWAPTNSLRQRITNEPGAVYEYTPVGNQRPEVEQLSTIPSYVFDFLKEVSGRLREVFGLTEVTEGQLPPNLEAADAIDLLQEMATDRFAPAILDNEKSLADLGQVMLLLMQQYYIEPRKVTLSGPGGIARVREFDRSNFAGNITVHVEAGSSLPKTRAARRKQIERWMELGLIQPQNAWKYFDTADAKELAARFARDEDHALREHDKIIAGTPLNPEGMQQAIQTVNTGGVNPQTGQPFQAPEEVQQFLEDAALSPGLADNDIQHEQAHRDYLTSVEFDGHSPDVRRRLLRHYELTIQKIANKPMSPEKIESPRVSLGVNADLGPQGVASILKQAGVQVDPQVLAQEPPMVTATYDSVDKADADAGSAGEEANNLSQVAQAMVMTDIANAKAQQDSAHKQRSSDQQQQAHDVQQMTSSNQEARAQEEHAQKMRQADELHQEKLKQMRKPQPKPTPKKT